MNASSKIDFTRRDVGIDLLRALTMFVMIFVNDLWTVSDYPNWIGHAARGVDFMGLADTVFPCFLFVVGMSVPFAIERRFSKGLSGESTVGHILSRTFALLIMGAFIVNSEGGISPEVGYSLGVYWILMVVGFICIWNQYPRTDDRRKKMLFNALKVLGVVILLFLAITFRDEKGGVFAAGWWGILGSIGWAYVVCALIYVFTRDRLRWLVPILVAFMVILMLGSRMNETWGGVPIMRLPRPNFYNDMLSVLHIGGSGVCFVMAGVVFSLLCAKYNNLDIRKKALWIAVAVVALLVAGIVARKFWILAKLGGTPTWVFYVCAIAVGMYALLSWLASRGWAGWMDVIKPAGTATLTCYLMPYVAYAVSGLTGITRHVLPEWFTSGFVGILNCLCFSLFIIGVVWLLGRVNIKLKI